MERDDEHETAVSIDKQEHFSDHSGMARWVSRIFYSICILLVLVEFIIHRHVETSVEQVPAFYAIYGFIACTILVLLAKQLRKLLMRDEKYYDAGAAALDKTAALSPSTLDEKSKQKGDTK